MSRYVASSIIELGDGTPDYGEVAYGYDRVMGPFFQRFDGQGELVEDVDYLFSGGEFDCHALAEKLEKMVADEDIEDSDELQGHISRLWLDLPI